MGEDIVGSEPVDIFKGNETVIIAPHPDDEIIGCYEILIKSNPVILYSGDLEAQRRETILNLKAHVKVKAQLFLLSVPASLMNKSNKFYYPDPIYEVHPEHRLAGHMGEQLARNGFDVTFYSVNMQAPYIHRTPNREGKLALLNTVYPDQKSLWESDNKYYLFEGYNKWIF